MRQKILILVLLIVGGFAVSVGQTYKISYKIGTEYQLNDEDETPLSNTIEDIIVVGDTIWLGTSKGVSRSFDRGITWKTIPFGDEGISAIGYNNGTIWAATWHFTEQLGQQLPEGSGIHYSRDKGETWTDIPQPLDGEGDSIIIYGKNNIRALPVTVKVQNFTRDIAFTPGTVWIVSFTSGLRKTTNLGETWERVLLPPDNLSSISPEDSLDFSLQPVAGNFGDDNNLNHRAFTVIAPDDTTLFAGTAGGINKSTDNGISWEKFNHTNQDNPISGNFIVSLDYNPQNNSIWAGSWKAEGETEFYGVSASFDGGLSWNTYLPGEKAHDIGFKEYVNNLGINVSDYFAATENGVFRSNNLGSTWISSPAIIDNQKNLPLTTNHFRSVDAFPTDNNLTEILLGSVNGLAKLSETDGIWGGIWKVFLSSKKLESKNDTYAFPNPFSPDFETIKIKYSLEQPGSGVTIRILDFGMNLVRTLLQNAPRSDTFEQIEIWDGTDEIGKIVPNGVYFYRIDIGSQDPLFGKIMVLK